MLLTILLLLKTITSNKLNKLWKKVSSFSIIKIISISRNPKLKREKLSYCFSCKENVGRLDTHLLAKHNEMKLNQYVGKFYISKSFELNYFNNKTESNVCLVCKKEVNWLQTHLETKHNLTINEYFDQCFYLYKDVVEKLKANIGYHYLLRPWDSYLIYQKKIERMVRSISIKKSLDAETTEDLQGKAIELFLRFHYQYDPNFETDNPLYMHKKTDDYYEKYMFSKIRAQLGYNVQKHYINKKREFEVGSSDEIEVYNRDSVSLIEIEEDVWKRIRNKLSIRQQDVFDLLLLGYTQSEISRELQLTQSWVSSIKALIRTIIQQCIDEDEEYRQELKHYYYTGSTS